MPAAQYYGVLCVIDFVQILPVHQAAPHGRGRVNSKVVLQIAPSPRRGCSYCPCGSDNAPGYRQGLIRVKFIVGWF